MYSSMDKLKKALSGDDEEEDRGIVTQKINSFFSSETSSDISDASTLSWSTRIKGFLICFILGVVLSILGSCLLFLPNGLVIFGVLYTLGNILSLSSTCFLMGPCNQLKKMFAKTRIIATILVFVMIILTLVCAFAVKKPALTIVCCILQFLALTWYSLSYIPFARKFSNGCLQMLYYRCSVDAGRDLGPCSGSVLLVRQVFRQQLGGGKSYPWYRLTPFSISLGLSLLQLILPVISVFSSLSSHHKFE